MIVYLGKTSFGAQVNFSRLVVNRGVDLVVLVLFADNFREGLDRLQISMATLRSWAKVVMLNGQVLVLAT